LKSKGKRFDATVSWSLSSRLQIFWTHNINQLCFTPVLLVCLKLHSRWGARCIWIIGTRLFKPHCITPLMKAMSKF